MASSILQIFQETLIFVLLNPFSLLPLLLSLFFLYKWISPNFTPKKNLPPSPPRLPIIGNLHQLGILPFRSLRTLSEKYGELMFLYLGSKPTIVVSSAEVASQVLKTHDLIFSNRPNLSIQRRLLGNGKDIGTSPYGEYWRKMRSICMLHLLSNNKVRSYREVREEEVALMIQNIQQGGPTTVNLGDLFMLLSNDVTCRVAFGRKYSGEDGNFKKMLVEFFKLLGGYNVGDFISWLGWINKINGFDAKVNNVISAFDFFLERIMEDHSNSAREDGGENKRIGKDFVDVLLQLQRDDTLQNTLLDRHSIKALILDVFGGGTETTSLVLEWMMSELLRNPRTMQELQKEVSRVVGDKETVTEDDLDSMSYMKAVYKETLRLHPPGPLMFPHESTEDITINGYDISAGTQVIVNIWAISRNPKYWEEPESFSPERFLNSPLDFKGRDFQFTPFGSGRRICPGMAFATATVELAIVNLVHHFDWSLPYGAAAESLDMTEARGITIRRKIPLLAVPSPRIH